MGTENNITINITDSEMQDVIQQYFKKFNVYEDNSSFIIIFLLLYVVLIFISFFGNILVIYVFWRNPSMRSSANFFLVNLAVADLMVTCVAMPTAAAQTVSMQWYLGHSMCRITHYVQSVAVSLSIYTITAMSIDRWQAINNPVQHRIFSSVSKTVWWIVSLWLLAVIQNLPIAALRTTHSYKILSESSGILLYEYIFCIEDLESLSLRRAFDIFWFIVSYAIPFCIITTAYFWSGWYLYSRNHQENTISADDGGNETVLHGRRNAAKSLFLMPLLFMLCWIPYSSLNLLIDFEGNETDTDVENSRISRKLLSLTVFLGHLNSIINPLLYCLLTKNFRTKVAASFTTLLHSFNWCRGRCSLNVSRTPTVNTLGGTPSATTNDNIFSITDATNETERSN